MNGKTWLTCVLIPGLGATAMAWQQPGAPNTPARGAQESQATSTTLRLCKVDTLIGLDVHGADNKSVGEVSDLIFDGEKGSLERVVIERGGVLGIGETKRVLPLANLSWKAVLKDGKSELEAHTLLKGEQLDALPKYDSEKFLTGRGTARVDNSGDPKAREASTRNLMVCADELIGCELHCSAAEGKSLGKVEQLVFDSDNQRIAYVVLAQGGLLGIGETRYALPWPAIDLSRDDKGKLIASCQLAETRFSKAPQYKSGEWERMSSPAWIHEMYSYYEAPEYWKRDAPREPKQN